MYGSRSTFLKAAVVLNWCAQAGLFGGLAGHDVDKTLMVEEIGADGEVHLHSSTLDEFEHFWKVFVDVGLVSLHFSLSLTASHGLSLSLDLTVS